MHHPAGRTRAPRALLAALVVVVGAVLLLSRSAGAQDCPVLQPDCNEPSTSTTVRSTPSTIRASTSTTEEDSSSDQGSGDGGDEETTTTAGRRSTTTEIVTTTTYTVTTLHNVLIPGDGTAGAESTTTTAPDLTTGTSGVSDETLILIIVSGLLVVAVVAGVLTYRYWAATRPRIVASPAKRATRSAFLD